MNRIPVVSRLWIVLCSALLTAGATIILMSSGGDRTPGRSEAPEFSPRRAKWELMRLRNPATGKIPDGIRKREADYAATLPRQGAGSAFYRSAGVQQYGWTARGPHNVGGRTRALALDISGEDTILAGGVSGGLWRSTDGGATWVKRTNASEHQSVTALVQDTRPGKSAVWYYGTGELYGNSASDPFAYYYGDGVHKSTDNGLTWERLVTTGSSTPTQFDERSDFTWSLAIDPSNQTQEEVYGAFYGTIRRSVNGGRTWTNVISSGGDSTSYVTDVAVTDSGVVYATLSDDGDRKGIWRSTLGSPGSFKQIMPTGWPARFNRIEIGIAPSNPNVVYFLAETPGYGHLGQNFRGDSSWQSLWKYTYLSGEGAGEGGRWENLSANLPKFGGANGDLFTQGGYDLHVTVKPDDERTVFIGGTSLYRSSDGFSTPNNTAWIGGFRSYPRDSSVIEGYSYPNHHADQHTLIFSRNDPSVAYSGSDGGVHKTLDCTADSIRWTSLNNGYNTTQFYAIAIDRGTEGSDLVIGGLQDNGTWGVDSDDPTRPWTLRGTSDGAYCAIVDGGREMYVSKQLGKVFRVLVDEQGTMTDYTRVDPLNATGFLFINPFELDPTDSRVMYMAGGHYLYRNHDLSQIPLSSNDATELNWTRFDKTLRPDTSFVSAVAVSTANPARRVYYGTSDGRVFRLDNAHEGEPDPIDATGSAFPARGYVTDIEVDPLNGDRVVAVFSNYEVQSLFLSEDAGETWTPIGGNLEPSNGAGPSCRSFAFLHRPSGTICFVATSFGLFSTNKLDGAATVWAQEGAETIGNVVVDDVKVRHSDGYVAIGTHANGVFSTHVVTLGTGGPVAGEGAGLRLEESIPNPAQTMATIRFAIPAGRGDDRVDLRVYDMRGAEVMKVVDEVLPAGEHQRAIDLRGLPVGAYLCRLQSRGLTAEGRLRVVR